MPPSSIARLVVCATALCLAALVGASPAAACEPYPCLPGSLLPAGGTIPANTQELRWYLGENVQFKSPQRHVRLERGGKSVAFKLEPLAGALFRIIPDDPLVVGETYVLAADNGCKYVGPKRIEATFVVGPEAPRPTNLGRVVVRSTHLDPLKIGTPGGSCSVQEQAAWADLEVELSAQAKPWAELIDFTVKVDGGRWRYASTLGRPPPPGQSAIGRGKARVYARCADPTDAFVGVGQGERSVVVEGSVFASGRTLETPPLSLSLDCKTGARVASDPPAVADSPAPTADSSESGSGAPTPPPAATPPRAPDRVDPDPPSASATCRVGNARSPASAAWLLGLLGLHALSRRRMRRAWSTMRRPI